MSDPPKKKQSVLAVQNIKGGVGKTTIAVNLAALLAEKHHKRVLLIDADPQCNASLYLLSDDEFAARTGEDPGRLEGNLYDVFHGDVRYFDVATGRPYGAKRKGSSKGAKVRDCKGGGSLSLLCGSAQLFDVQEIAAEVVISRIKRWLGATGDAYEHVIIDCPPSISSLSLSALKAADKILVPMTANQFSVHGLPLLLKSLEKYREVFSIKAKIAGVVLSMFPRPDAGGSRTNAEKHLPSLASLCGASKPHVPFFSALISMDPAYPASYETHTPLPFSNDSNHQPLIDELQAVASEAGLIGGTP
jgi:chromosome partitioning protein